MSTVSRTPAPGPRPARPRPNPYRYGYRYVRIKTPDGTYDYKQVPLTPRDVLFPRMGDFIVQSNRHISDVIYSRTVFKARLAGDSTALVLADCLIDWNIPGVKPLGPDIAVFLGVKRDGDTDWNVFNVA